MNVKKIKLLSLSTGSCFLVSLIMLFCINPQTFTELNNISLASYNLPGMNARWCAMLGYIITGLSSILFGISLPIKKSSYFSRLGKILIISNGLLWMSFGVITYNPISEASTVILLGRIGTFVLMSFLGIFLLVVDDIAQDNFLKYYSMASAGIILILTLLSSFVFSDETWIRTNVSFVTYFCWFIVFGVVYQRIR